MNKFLGLCFFLMLSLPLQAQNKGFQSKEKKETAPTPVSENVIKGADNTRTMENSPFLSKPFVKPAPQVKTIRPLSANNSTLLVASSKDGLPKFIEVKRNNSNERRPAQAKDKKAACKIFLQELRPQLNFSDKSDFAIVQEEEHRVKLKQTYKGIEIYGKEILLHFNEYGEGTIFNGNYSACDFELDTNASIGKEQALGFVLNDLQTKTQIVELSDRAKEFYQYYGPSIRKIILEGDATNPSLLAYEIEIKPNVLGSYKYFIDADKGTILRSYQILCSVDGPHTANATDLYGVSRAINTYLEGSQYKLVNTTKPMYNATTKEGKIVTVDAQGGDGDNFKEITTFNNVWNHPAGISAHYNADIAYDYFKNVHGRNSINGQGGTITSFVNVSDGSGTGMDNAYWDGKAIYYGNGNTDFYPLARALDVAGHEMTHGVVQNTANLEYYAESGAINESMADIFGFMMDSLDWKIGEDVVKLTAFPSGALRNLQDPHNGGTDIYDGYQPKHVSEQYNGTLDNRGVHINSGIPNHAFYLLATSTSKSRAGQIFYKALSVYLTRFSDFVDLRFACIQSAQDLGATPAEIAKVEQAFDAVGIVGTVAPPTSSTTIPVNPGQDYLLTVDTDPAFPGTLYHSTTAGTNPYYMLSTKDILSKPSVTDNGSRVVYVASDNKIYSVNLTNPASTSEVVLDNRTIWGNVAISKDGTKLAAVSKYQDTLISVYHFATNVWKDFKLYNPTYSGVKSGGPVYADALEWDYRGEYLIYDAFNKLTNVSGTSIEYWDVNFIKVWDRQANTFSTGEIEKLFSNLPEGVSIGNPTLSKNSPYIIAFDYEDESTYAIIGYDMENNRQEVIMYNNYLGWPTYSRLDNKIAYTSLYLDQFNDVRPGIWGVSLNPDKISSFGPEANILPEAEFPVYYTVGSRNVILGGIEDKSFAESNVKAYPNPFDNTISLKSKGHKITEVVLYDLKGSIVQSQRYDSFEETIHTDNLPQGMYLIKVILEESQETFKMIKN